jgi:hypothetical protein
MTHFEHKDDVLAFSSGRVAQISASTLRNFVSKWMFVYTIKNINGTREIDLREAQLVVGKDT